MRKNNMPFLYYVVKTTNRWSTFSVIIGDPNACLYVLICAYLIEGNAIVL